MIFRTVNYEDKKVIIGATTKDEWKTVLELVDTIDGSCAVGKTNIKEE
jgi:hypothetical protein